MSNCSHCSAEIPESGRFCAACGRPKGTHPIPDETATSLGDVPPPPSSFTDPSAGGRFIPGTVLQSRYRIVGLLGRGGMGEVYRADDLKLGQSVALKWLPRNVEKDASRLDRFLGEVRHSLKVTHPNVCRVFDVGEVDGQHFLSMEYVDGEDLSSLLRRIGRLPEDKAIQVARQLCAGLAAAHEEGVLHRDLKPANVMIDGRGRTKITDFGLAGKTEGIEGAEARAGTPGYMAPEQLAGRELTKRTDIYSLGLVLYELFTGQRAFEAGSLAEMARKQESTPTTLSSHVQNLDPTIESIIMRCLAVDPTQRPPSAEAVAMALPGGDPLEAALAAGETPSPDMVAATGGPGVLNARIGWSVLAVTVILMAAAMLLRSERFLIDPLQPEKPPAVLVSEAQEILRSVGLHDISAENSHGFLHPSTAAAWLQNQAAEQGKREWIAEASPTTPWMRFWYRQRDGLLSSPEGYGYTEFDNPVFIHSGEARVVLDHHARLLRFDAVPDPNAPTESTGTESASFDWTPLLVAAGGDTSCLTPTEPQETPLFFADRHVAWEGDCEGWPYGRLRIEATSLGDRPVHFRVEVPWEAGTTARSGSLSASSSGPPIPMTFVLLAMTVVAAVMARRNLKVGRGDLRGANVILFVYVVGHTLSILPLLELRLSEFYKQVVQMISMAGYQGAVLWISYLALEPIVRRRWPTMLVSWSRLLQGGVVDPLVGRDVLAGCCTAALGVAISALLGWSQLHLEIGPSPSSILATTDTITGGLRPFLWLIHLPMHIMEISMTAMLLFVVLTIVLRSSKVATAVLIIVPTGISLLTGQPVMVAAIFATMATLFLTVTLRFGYLALAVTAGAYTIQMTVVVSADFGHWYGTGSLIALTAVALVACYGFWVSLAGRPMFGNIE